MNSFARFSLVGACLLSLGLQGGFAQAIHLNAGDIDTSQAVPATSARALAAATTGSQLHLVQFDGPIQPEWVAQLEQDGYRIVNYIPDNAYLVYGGSTALKSLRSVANPHLQWEGAYVANDKINPRAKPEVAAARLAATGENDLFAIQLVRDSAVNAETVALITSLATEPLKRDDIFGDFRNIVVRMAPAEVDTIAARPDVISIAPYVQPRKKDERQDIIISGQLTGNGPTGPGYLSWLATKGFTQQQFTDSGLLVDVCDSGLDNGSTNANHFGLYVSGNTGQASRVMYNRVEGTASGSGSTTAGCDGHGTLNAHIIGGYNNSSNGFPHQDSAGYRYGLGVAPFVRLGSSVIFDNSTNRSTDVGDFTYPDYEDMISRAYRDGARISSDSWGADTAGAYDIDAQAYDALVRDAQPTNSAVPGAGNQGMIIVFAAGNAGASGAGTVGSPGTAKNVITVGAAENVHSHSTTNKGESATGLDGCDTPDTEANSANDMATFSSRGPCSDSRNKPEICAPGTHVTGGVAQSVKTMSGTGSALACFDALGVCGLQDDSGNYTYFFPTNQEWYSTSSGTSHSTPAVAGGAALVYQYFINQGWSTNPSPAMVKAYLMNSARYMTGVDANDDLWSNVQGMGMMNLGMAFDGGARILRDQLTNDLFTASGQTRRYYGMVTNASQPVRITLGWTDAPGSTTGNAYNNDLNLVVTVGGVVYKGNVFSGAYSASGGTADAKNNVESVFLPAGTTGLVQIVVSGYNINSDGVPNFGGSLDQDFALVVANATAFTPSNYPPEIDPIGNKTVSTNQLLSFTVSAADSVDSDTVSLWADGIPAWATFAGATNAAAASCLFSGTAPSATGTYAVTFYAADKDGTNSEAITITVNDCVPANIIDEGFADGTNAPSGWSFTGIGATYTSAGNYGLASPSLKMDATGDQIVTPALNTPTNLSFWYKGQGTTMTSTLLIEGYNGSSWSTVVDLTSLATTATTQSVVLADGLSQLRFTFTKVSGNLALDDVIIGGCGGGAAVNHAPVISVAGGTNQSVGVNNLLSFVVTVSDADVESVGVFTNAAPAGASFPEASGTAPIQSTFTWTPTVTGAYAATFVAYDALVAVTQTVAITVTEPVPELLAPVIQAASDVQANQFNANWLASSNATGYYLDVATNASFTAGGGASLTNVSEDFSLYTRTNSSADVSTNMNAYMHTAGWTGAKVYENIGTAKMGSSSAKGYLITPTVDLSANGGAATLTFDLGQYGSDTGPVQVMHAADGSTFSQVGSDITPPASLSTQTIEITGGTALSKIQITAKNTSNNRYYLDNFKITQLAAGRRYVPGYQTRDVGNVTIFAVTGLTESVTYYYRAKAYNASSNSAYSGTTNVTTAAGVNVPPVLGAIGSKSVGVGSNLQFQVAATPTDGDTVTLTASNLPAGATFNATNENGTFQWLSASPTGVYTVTFYATDKDGSDSEAVAITVNSGSTELLAPVIQAASSIQATQFNANWLASDNATGYRLDVGTNDTFSGGGGGGGLSVLASNAASVATITNDGWSGYAYGGTSFLVMTQSTAVVTSPAFSTVGFTNLTVDLRARTYGGVNAITNTITVSISTNNGAAWTVMGTAVPTNSTLNAMATLTNTANLGYSQTMIRWQTLAAGKGIGAGISNLVVKGWSSGGSTPAYVPGYENRDVANVTTYAVTGLTEGVTYYYRVKAYNVSSNSGYSAVTSVVTAAASGTPPVLGTIGDQSVFLGETLQFQVSATPTEADAVTLTASNLPAGAAFYPTNQNGTFLWTSASPTGLYNVSFYATDKDGADSKAIGITVYPLPDMGAFTMTIGSPASATLPSVAGQTYQMQFSSNIWEFPVLWSNVDSKVGTGGSITLADTNTLIDIKRYYRVVIP